MPEIGGFDSRDMAWDAPEGWEQAPDKAMRLVTYGVGGAECYVSLMSGSAGGVGANVNRWRQQMGQPGLSQLELAALPKITVMGQEATLMEVKGDYDSGMGDTAKAAQGMLGIICSLTLASYIHQGTS